MRKAVSYTIGLQKHQACGAFLHFLRMFERLAPPADYDRAYVELHKMFLRGLLDADLQHVLTTSFPPGDLSAIAAFRQLAMNYNDLKFYLVTTLFLRFTASSFWIFLTVSFSISVAIFACCEAIRCKSGAGRSHCQGAGGFEAGVGSPRSRWQAGDCKDWEWPAAASGSHPRWLVTSAEHGQGFEIFARSTRDPWLLLKAMFMLPVGALCCFQVQLDVIAIPRDAIMAKITLLTSSQEWFACVREGRLHVEKYLGERACLVEQTDTYESQHALGDFLKFKEQFRGISGQQ